MVAAIGPRLPYSATLGTRYVSQTPKRFGLTLDGLQSLNLFEVGLASRMLPKVAEYSNLGLKGAIPLGLLWQISQRSVTPLPTACSNKQVIVRS